MPQVSCPFKNYANAPNMTAQAWPGFIVKMEGECGKKIGHAEGNKIFKILQGLSKDARKEWLDAKNAGCSSKVLGSIRKKQFIVYDKKTKLWRGRLTPSKRESLGLERSGARGDQSENSLRSRHDNHPAQFRHAFLKTIIGAERSAGFECDMNRAIAILEKGRKREWLEYDSESGTWRGARQPEPKSVPEAIQVIQLADRQALYWKLFADLPEMKHDWQNPEKSEVILYALERAQVIGLEPMTVDDVITCYHRAWKCSDDILKIPLRKNRSTGVIYGFNTFLEKKFQDMPEVKRNSAHENSDLLGWMSRNFGDDNPYGHLSVAIMAGHVVDLGNYRYVGACAQVKIAEQKKLTEIQERVRIEEDRYIARNAARVQQAKDAERSLELQRLVSETMSKLNNPETLSAVRMMPRTSKAEFGPQKWIRDFFGLEDWDVGGLVYFRLKGLGHIVSRYSGTEEGAEVEGLRIEKALAKRKEEEKAEAEEQAKKEAKRKEWSEKLKRRELTGATSRPTRHIPVGDMGVRDMGVRDMSEYDEVWREGMADHSND